MKTKIQTEKELVFSEWKKLYYSCSNLHNVNDVKFPSEVNFCLGKKVEHVKEDNYREVFEKLFNDNNFSILMMDGGIISLFYKFEQNGDVCSHCLHYFPNILIESEEDDIYNLFSDYENKNILSKYVRIDFGKIGFQEHYHSACHIHFSLNKDGVRIPCNSWVSPMEFYMFIMTYIYHAPVDIDKTSKRKVLTENELLKCYLKFGGSDK